MDRNIKITILGSGVMIPTKERNPAGFLVEAGGKKILLDCGHGIIRRLVDYDIDLQSLDAVFISHFHTDHFGDAFNLVHSRWVDDTYNKRQNKELLFIGPKDLENRFTNWRKIFWPEPSESYPVKFKEGPGKFNINDVEIEIFEVKHIDWFQSVGIKINYEGKSMVYTGDIGSRQDIVALGQIVQDCDILITEASYEEPTPNHFTFSQVKDLAENANVKKVLVVHLSPQRIERVKQLISETNSSNFILGLDGLELLV